MESVISGARSGVLRPLQSALDSGDSTRVTNELKTKCLSNGTSYSYHYGSKMDLETMKAVTSKIEKIVTIAGYGTEIKEVKTHLVNAEKSIDSVGTSPYTVEVQATNTSQPTVSPTDVEGNPYAEWKYIDPSLVTVSSEEDEKVIDV